MEPLIAVAGLGAVAYVVGRIFRRFVPEIVVFLVFGVLIGPEGPLSLLDEQAIASLELVTLVALAAIIFRLGERLRLSALRGLWGKLVPLNVAQLVGTGLLVFFATLLAGADPRLAILLALIGAETGVLTVTAVVKEERADGDFTELLLASVGVTNAAVAILFGLTFPLVLAATGEAGTTLETVGVFGRMVVASTLIGLVAGWLLERFSADIETSGELLLYLLIVLTGLAGLGGAVDGSVVVAALVAGVYVANRAPWLSARLFEAIRTLEAPIYLVFFVVAGAGIHLDAVRQVGAVGAVYVAARLVGKVGGSAVGSALDGQGSTLRDGARMGAALLPHAGMAVALVAFIAEQSPDLGQGVAAVVLGGIVIFELSGPLFTRRALRGSGDAGRDAPGRSEMELPELAAPRGFQRVLVPVGALRIVLPRMPFLLDLVASFGATLIAVHISRPGSDSARAVEPEVLRVVGELAAERGVGCVLVHRVSEHIGEQLAQVAHEEAADLIVMGEPARRALLEPKRWGAVAQRVTEAVDIPVLVYPVDPSDPDDVPHPPLRRGDVREQPAEGDASHDP